MIDFDAFTRAEIIQLVIFAIAFIIGALIATLVAVKETAELRRLRKAKRLMYEDEVRQQMLAMQQQKARPARANPAHPRPTDGESFA